MRTRPACLGRLLVLVLVWLSGAAAARLPEAVRFSTADGLPSNVVHQVVQDRHGYLWFATDDGLARFDGRQFRVWRREQGLADNQLLSLAVDAHDQLWMGSGYGTLMRMSADRTRIDHFGGARHPALAGVPIGAVLPDADGTVWVGTRWAGLFRLDPQQRLRQFLPTLRDDGVPAGDVEHLVRDGDGVLWIGTAHGLARWHTGRFHRPPDPGVARAAITGLGVDAAGMAWISTAVGQWQGQGIGALQAVSAPLHGHLLGIGGEGAHWLARGGQVWRQPAGGGRGGAAPVSLTAAGGGVPPRLHRVFEDRYGGAWLLGRHLGVWRLPPRWWQFDRQPAPLRRRGLDGFSALPGRTSVELDCAREGYWRIHDGTLERRGIARRREVRWALQAADAVHGHGPLSLHCAADGGVWLGGGHGLARWRGGRLQPVAGAPRDITALHVAADGALWVAAAGVLERYRWQGDRLHRSLRLDHRDGLPAYAVRALATDADGMLWGTSNHGLLRVVPARRQVRLYTRDDGIPAALLQASLQADGGRMLAIDAQGAMAFDPALLAQPAVPSALVIERVQVRRDARLLTLPSLAPLQLHAEDRDIQITARVLSAQLDPGQQYRFRLRDGERGWRRTRSRGTIDFPRLPPGLQVLEYQERSGQGPWSAVHTLALHVQPGGWQHPGPRTARAVGAIALLALLAWAGWRSLARSRARRAVAQRHAWAQQSAQAKTRYLATFGHEVRTPLTGVLGMTELLLASSLDPQQRQRLQRIERGGRQLLAIVDQALDDARMEAGRLPLHCIDVDLVALLPRWQHRMQPDLRAHGSSLDVHLHLPGATPMHTDPQRLQQLLQRVLDALVETLCACRISVRVDWLPGRSGLRVDIQALATPATPLPAAALSSEALQPARACVHALGGSLWCGPGPGWQVVLSLPMTAGGRCETDAPDSAGPVSNGAPPCRGGQVLLVEDDALVAEVHAALLAAGGAHVVTAAHALAALGELAVARFDVVLLDLDLPGVDGWQLLDMLRAQACTVPVVVVTARCEAGLAAQALAAGAVDLLHKPASGEQLLAAVRAARQAGRIVAA
ncbi:response regulator [Bacillus subtilis subsp. subtilis]|nr:response regulator [Bacillus subtilis subsp. subtilis]